jgi:hypothetical protein
MIMRRIHFLPSVAGAYRAQESVAAPARETIKDVFDAVASNFSD